MPKTLAIVGAGPKAAAIVARATILRELLPTRSHPDIVVFERNAPGSAWRGGAGYTSGFLTLCSPAEKDIGFPYSETMSWMVPGLTTPVSPSLFARYSWSSFLVSTGGFANWVDRGRDFPSHSLWASYITWVFEEAKQPWVQAEASRVSRKANGRWTISYGEAGATKTLDADGVVLTGSGSPRRIPGSELAPADRVYDPHSFWAARQQFSALREGTIVVVGDGGAAGAIVAWLANALAEETVAIVCVSPMGTLLPRGDGFTERRWFSDPDEWKLLTPAHRRALLGRTEAGVISLRNKRIIDAADNLVHMPGRAEAVSFDVDELTVTVRYDDGDTPVPADYLINAMGFDPWSPLENVAGKAAAKLVSKAPDGQTLRGAVEEQMADDLSLPPISGLPSGLHLPGLAALAQGPGMPTLGCLGLLAQAILDGYIT